MTMTEAVEREYLHASQDVCDMTEAERARRAEKIYERPYWSFYDVLFTVTLPPAPGQYKTYVVGDKLNQRAMFVGGKR